MALLFAAKTSRRYRRVCHCCRESTGISIKLICLRSETGEVAFAVVLTHRLCRSTRRRGQLYRDTRYHNRSSRRALALAGFYVDNIWRRDLDLHPVAGADVRRRRGNNSHIIPLSSDNGIIWVLSPAVDDNGMIQSYRPVVT